MRHGRACYHVLSKMNAHLSRQSESSIHPGHGIIIIKVYDQYLLYLIKTDLLYFQ